MLLKMLVFISIFLLLQNSAFGKTVKISSIVDEPFLMKNDNGELEGFSKDLAEEISKKLKFDNYEIKLVKDGKYGVYDESTKTWTGMIGELVDDKVDFIIAPLTINSRRAKDIEFSIPFMNVHLSILTKKAELCQSHYTFLYPFSTNLWMASVLAVFGIVFVLALDQKFKNKFNLYDFLKKDTCCASESIAAKVIIGTFFVFIVILLAAYTASFTTRRMEGNTCQSSMNSFEDLASQTEIKFGILSGGSTESYFKKSEKPLLQRMYKRMQAEKTLMTNFDDGIKKVREGGFAFIIESAKADYVINQAPCDLETVSQSSGLNREFAVALPKNSNSKTDLNVAILELKETGVIESLIKKWWKEMGECSSSNAKISNQVNLENMAGLFYLLITGIILAVFVAFLEKKMNQKGTEN